MLYTYIIFHLFAVCWVFQLKKKKKDKKDENTQR